MSSYSSAQAKVTSNSKIQGHACRPNHRLAGFMLNEFSASVRPKEVFKTPKASLHTNETSIEMVRWTKYVAQVVCMFVGQVGMWTSLSCFGPSCACPGVDCTPPVSELLQVLDCGLFSCASFYTLRGAPGECITCVCGLCGPHGPADSMLSLRCDEDVLRIRYSLLSPPRVLRERLS